jgi:hypothetical protein
MSSTSPEADASPPPLNVTTGVDLLLLERAKLEEQYTIKTRIKSIDTHLPALFQSGSLIGLLSLQTEEDTPVCLITHHGQGNG